MKYTITERRILFETSDQEAHEYATTQAIPPADIVELVKVAQGAIDKSDLHADGFGPEPHITVLYGLDDVDKEKVMEVMRNAGPLRARVSGIDIFQNDDQDVVIFAVDSEDLTKLHDAIDQEIPENGNRWPDYKPHMTIAYVLPGKGEAYKDLESELVGREFDLDALEFSDTQDQVDRVDLRGVPVEGVQKIHEESPLFGTDIVEDPEEPGMREALYPILNRSNRRAVSAKPDDEGMSVLLDNGDNLIVTRGPNESWSIAHKDKTFDTSKLGDIEALATRLRSPTEQVQEQGEADWPDPDLWWTAYDEPESRPGDDEPPEPRADDDAPPEKRKKKRKNRSRTPTYKPLFPTYARKMGQLGAPSRKQGEPAEEPVRAAGAPQEPSSQEPSSQGEGFGHLGAAHIHNNGYAMTVSLDQPTHQGPRGRSDSVDQAISALNSGSLRDRISVRRHSVSSIVVDIHDRNPVEFKAVRNEIDFRLGERGFEVRDATKGPRPTLWQRVRGKVADDVAEDTFTSDVGFTDTIPITRGRRRKVSLPGLSRAGSKRRKVSRRYDVKESISKGTTPILIVLRPQQVAALDAKPVWSALRESGVINARPFKMGEEPFIEVRIDTLRKEWSQANAGVLLDEVGSIDPRIQRAVMEGIDADELAKVVRMRLGGWCRNVPVDVALKESKSFAESHRLRRLSGATTDEKWFEETVVQDEGVVRKVLEWYDLSRDVLERLAAIDKPAQYTETSHQFLALRSASKAILEDETTDPAAGIGTPGSGMPSGNPMGAETQGYAEQLPMSTAGVSVSSRNWPAQGMFKIHVMVGDAPQWVYRQVVGHEGEGDQSLLVYRTPEGRVMRMPHEEIDAASGFGAVVSPEELMGTAQGEEPIPTFEPSGPESSAPQVAAIPANMGEETNPDQEKLTRDAGFSKALAQYQQSKDEKDWDLVRKEAERATGKRGADVDAMLAPFASQKSTEKQPMMGGAYEQIVPPEDVEGVGESVEERQATAIKMFVGDEQFHSLLNKFESTRNEGYLMRASERAARVAGISLREARSFVEEILEATKK